MMFSFKVLRKLAEVQAEEYNKNKLQLKIQWLLLQLGMNSRMRSNKQGTMIIKAINMAR